MDTDAVSRGLLIQYESSNQFRCVNLTVLEREVWQHLRWNMPDDVMQLSLLMKH